MAEEKKFYWLKMMRGFFKRHDISIIENINPNDKKIGKQYVLFYIKLMLESIDHEGTLRFSEELPYDYEMLAAVTDTETEIVEAAMDLFIKLKMVEIFDDETIFLPGVLKLIGSETAAAERMRKQRKGNNSVTKTNNVQKCYIEKEKEKKKDKELEKKIEEEERENNCEQVTEKYAALCPSLPPLEILSDSIKTDLIESIEKYGLEKFDLLFKKAEASAFLTGKNDRKWLATFDWLIKADNMAKVLNGNFDNKKPKKAYSEADKLFLSEDELLELVIKKSDEEPVTIANNENLKVRAEALKEKLRE